MGSERRLHPRLEVDLDGRMRLEGSDTCFPVRISNLSVTGAAVECDIGLDPGKRLSSLEFLLPATKSGSVAKGGVTLDLAATVSRRITVAPLADEEPRYILGLEFQDVAEPVQKVIHRYVFQEMIDRRSRREDRNGQRAQRVPYRQPITLSYDSFSDFETQLTENLSVDGMFIRTAKPYPPGTIFDFQLLLRDDFSLVKGRGEVVWIREREDSPRLPAGMGTRFVQIDDAGRDVIHRVVAHHLEEEAKVGEPAGPVPMPEVVEAEETSSPETPDADRTDEYDTPETSGLDTETQPAEDPEIEEAEEAMPLPAPGSTEPAAADATPPTRYDEPPSLPSPELLTGPTGDADLSVAGYASARSADRRWLWLLVPLAAIAGLAFWILG